MYFVCICFSIDCIGFNYNKPQKMAIHEHLKTTVESAVWLDRV